MAEDVFGIVGTVIAGAYQVEAVVAEGGFGVVYRAYHSGFRAPVAVKCLKVPQQLTADQEALFLEQFRAEAELLFRLSASIPTVVRPLHVDAMTLPDGRFVPFMALEWLEGETLDAISQRRKAEGLPPIPLKKLVRMLTPVARALERAHNYMGPTGPISIVHRDLKPENIFVANVAGEEVVKILDFGIGKAKSVASQVAGRASQTNAGFAAFSPAYGAPEQWVPKRFGQTGPWTDVWGLALTIVEIMAGRNIIDGDHAAMMGTALDPNRRPTPRNEGLDVTDGVENVFLKALAVDPRERYSDAGAFWSDLVAAVGVRAESHDSFPYPSHDARVEAGAVPRVETVEAAALGHGGARRRVASAAMPAQAAVAAGVYPDVEPPGSQRLQAAGGGMAGLELGEIPDLAPAPDVKPKTMKKSERPPAYSRELDFDDQTSNKLKMALEVDLAPGERPSLRVPAPGSRPDWPIPSEEPGTDARRRVSSASVPVVAPAPVQPGSMPPQRRAAGASGAYPVAGGPPPSAERVLPSTPPDMMSSPRGGLSGAPPAAASSPAWPLPNVPPPVVMPAEPPSIVRRLAPGAVMVVLSIVVTLADQMYASNSGEVFTLGPVRGTWIAGVLMLAGVVTIAVRLIPSHRP